MKKFVIMARRAIDSLGCDHVRCRRQEFYCHWEDYMYGLNGKARFDAGIFYDVPHFYQ